MPLLKYIGLYTGGPNATFQVVPVEGEMPATQEMGFMMRKKVKYIKNNPKKYTYI